jgi:hypothetical protein
MTDVQIKRALLSVSDKTGLIDRRHGKGAARCWAKCERYFGPDRLS